MSKMMKTRVVGVDIGIDVTTYAIVDIRGTIIAPKVEKVKPSEPVKMQEYKDTNYVKWVEGRYYHLTVLRQPCDTLPMVKDETGQKFVDNLFQMTVTRTDGSVFFDRKFTKNSFNKYINEDYRNTGILEE